MTLLQSIFLRVHIERVLGYHKIYSSTSKQHVGHVWKLCQASFARFPPAASSRLHLNSNARLQCSAALSALASFGLLAKVGTDISDSGIAWPAFARVVHAVKVVVSVAGSVV